MACHSEALGEGRMSRQAAWPPASRTARARVMPRPLPPPVMAIVLPARERRAGVVVLVAAGGTDAVGGESALVTVSRADGGILSDGFVHEEEDISKGSCQSCKREKKQSIAERLARHLAYVCQIPMAGALPETRSSPHLTDIFRVCQSFPMRGFLISSAVSCEMEEVDQYRLECSVVGLNIHVGGVLFLRWPKRQS